MSKSETKVMHSILHHFGDWELETRHMSRVERSIYFDMRTLYLTGVGLTADLDLLERHLMCNESNEKEALQFLLRDKFKLCKKSNQYKHIGWNKVLRGYKEPKKSNASVTERNEESNESVTESNAKSNAERQAKLREQAKLFKDYLVSLNVVFDKKIPFSKLKELFLQHGGVIERNAESNESVTERNDSNEENNAEKVSITNNQEPILNTHTPPAREAKWERFAMHTDWTFDESNVLVLMRMAGIGGKLFDPVLQDSRFRFVNYHSAKPDGKHTQAEWESKLVSWLLADWRKHEAEPVKLVKPAQREETAPTVSKTKQSVMALMSAKEAVLSGQVETILPKPVFVVMVDGLLDLLGQGLSYPPASDAWAFTLSVWGGELAKRGLDGDDAGRLQTAFAELKKWALSDAGGRKFPEISDLVKCLPARIVPLIRKVETAEEFEQRKARGRRGMEKIKASLKGA